MKRKKRIEGGRSTQYEKGRNKLEGKGKRRKQHKNIKKKSLVPSEEVKVSRAERYINALLA